MVKRAITYACVVCVCVSISLALVGCLSKEIPVEGKYYSTSQEGFQISLEFDNHQVRLSSDLNTGPWRDYKRNGDTIEVTGLNRNGTKSTLTIEVIDDKSVGIRNLFGDQDVRFRKH